MAKKITYYIQFLLAFVISFSVSAKEVIVSDPSFYNVKMMDSLVGEYANQIKQQQIDSKLVADGDLQLFINLLSPGALGICDYSAHSSTLNRELNDLYNLNPKSFSYYIVTTNYTVFDRLMDQNAYKNALAEYLNSSQITIEGLKGFKQNIINKIIYEFSNKLLLELTFINDDTKVILDLVTVTTGMCGGAEATIPCNTRVDAHLYFDQRFPQDFVTDFWTRFNSQTTTFSRNTTESDIILSSEQVCNIMMELLHTKIRVFKEMKNSNLATYLSELQTTNDPLRIIEIINRLYTDDILEIDQELRLRLVTILSKINLTEANRGEQAVLKLLINTDLNQQAGFMLAGIKQNHILERLIYVVDDNASFSSGLYNPNYTKIIFTFYAYALTLDEALIQNNAYKLIENNKTFLWKGDGITTFPGYSIKFNTAGNGLIVSYTNGTSINLDLFEPIGIISSVPLPAYNTQSAGSYYDIVVPAIYLQWLLQKKDIENISQAGEVGVQVLSVVSGTGALLTTTSRVVRVLSVVEIASGLAGLADNLTDLRTVIHQKYGEPGAAFVDNILFITNAINLFGAGTSLLNLEAKLDNAIEFWLAKRNTIKVEVFADDLATFNQLDDLLKRQGDEIVEVVQGAGSLDDLVSWASRNGLSHLTRAELDDIFKFVDNNLEFAKRVANSTKEIQSATTLTELAAKLNLPITPASKSLTPYQTRVWYAWRKAKIGDMLDKTQTLENQAKQAVNMRNEIRSGARQGMIDSDIADFLDAKEPNKTWEQLVQEKIDKGFIDDAIYQEIINSSMKGRPTVDNVFKIPIIK